MKVVFDPKASLLVGGVALLIAAVFFALGWNSGRAAASSATAGTTAGATVSNTNATQNANAAGASSASEKTTTAPAPQTSTSKTGTSGGTTQPSTGSGQLPTTQGSDITGKIGPEPGF